jgi:hypothetical protein
MLKTDTEKYTGRKMHLILSTKCDQSIFCSDKYLASYCRSEHQSACRPSYRAVVKFVLHENKLKGLGNYSYEIKFNEAFLNLFPFAAHVQMDVYCDLKGRCFYKRIKGSHDP